MSRARELAGFATAVNPIQDINAGVVTAISFSGDGSALTGIDATSIKDGDGTVRAQANTSGVFITGIATATNVSASSSVTGTTLYGDGSNLTGLPAGLGTAIAATGDGSNVYYTNQVLDIGSNLTIDVPATAVVAYTQYPEIAVASGIDLIIANGDDFVADILGIGTTGAPSALAGGGGRVRADNFVSRDGYNAPGFANGISVTGVATAGVGTFSTSVVVGSAVTANASGIIAAGVATAGVGTFSTSVVVGSAVTANSDGVITSGIVTATTFVGALTGNVTGNASGSSGSCTGNAAGLTGTPDITVGAVAVSGIATFSGGVDYSGGATLREKVNIVANKLSAAPNINLDDGMSHYFTTQETTTATPNIISSVGINTELATGDMLSVTVITTAAAGGYSETWKVDGVDTGITTSWVGGSVPDEGGDSGLDTYALTLIKTGNAAYTIINNLVNSA